MTEDQAYHDHHYHAQCREREAMADLLCPKCDGVTVEHTIRRMAELLAENDRLRARIAFWHREYCAFTYLSGETIAEMYVAGRPRESGSQ